MGAGKMPTRGKLSNRSRRAQKTPIKPSLRNPFPSNTQFGGHGPGTYDTGKNFGEGLKPILIFGKYKMEKKSGPGPGEYDTTRAEALTRPKSPTQRMSRGASRAKVPKQSSNIGPGSYPGAEPEFTRNSSPMTISRTRREQPIKPSAGPGEYDIDKAYSAIKPRLQSGRMSTSTRPDNFSPVRRSA
jgi:hypothetical protein